MNLPERFDLTYTGADGEKHRPVMIHRVVYGSLERFIGILTEQFGGAFPTWLAPVQVKILTIVSRGDEAAKELQSLLLTENLRPELDLRNEKIGFKVREAQMQKIPYMFVLGDREAEAKTVTIRNRKGDNLGTVPFAEAVAMIKKLNDEKNDRLTRISLWLISMHRPMWIATSPPRRRPCSRCCAVCAR